MLRRGSWCDDIIRNSYDPRGLKDSRTKRAFEDVDDGAKTHVDRTGVFESSSCP